MWTSKWRTKWTTLTVGRAPASQPVNRFQNIMLAVDYVLAGTYRVDGPLTRERLEAALQRLHRRQPNVRLALEDRARLVAGPATTVPLIAHILEDADDWYAVARSLSTSVMAVTDHLVELHWLRPASAVERAAPDAELVFTPLPPLFESDRAAGRAMAASASSMGSSGRGDHWLVFVAHHVICDARSMFTLGAELIDGLALGVDRCRSAGEGGVELEDDWTLGRSVIDWFARLPPPETPTSADHDDATADGASDSDAEEGGGRRRESGCDEGDERGEAVKAEGTVSEAEPPAKQARVDEGERGGEAVATRDALPAVASVPDKVASDWELTSGLTSQARTGLIEPAQLHWHHVLAELDETTMEAVLRATRLRGASVWSLVHAITAAVELVFVARRQPASATGARVRALQSLLSSPSSSSSSSSSPPSTSSLSSAVLSPGGISCIIDTRSLLSPPLPQRYVSTPTSIVTGAQPLCLDSQLWTLAREARERVREGAASGEPLRRLRDMELLSPAIMLVNNYGDYQQLGYRAAVTLGPGRGRGGVDGRGSRGGVERVEARGAGSDGLDGAALAYTGFHMIVGDKLPHTFHDRFGVLCWSLNGRLTIVLPHSPAYFKEATLQHFLRALTTLLRLAVGLPIEDADRVAVFAGGRVPRSLEVNAEPDAEKEAGDEGAGVGGGGVRMGGRGGDSTLAGLLSSLRVPAADGTLMDPE